MATLWEWKNVIVPSRLCTFTGYVKDKDEMQMHKAEFSTLTLWTLRIVQLLDE